MSNEKTIEKPLLILPAAGFAARLGYPESKELFLRSDGRPFIQWSLDVALEFGWPVLVTTREEKKNLICFLNDYRERTKLELEIQITEPTKEWTETVGITKPFWNQTNIVCLPDSEFSPIAVLREINNALSIRNKDAAWGVFGSDEFSEWGCLQEKDEQLFLSEKPKVKNWNDKLYCWGCFGFKQEKGSELLNHFQKTSLDHSWQRINLSYELIQLKSYTDLSRI